VAVLAGEPRDYARRHSSTALLVVEVAQSSLAQDRLTKPRIYAAAAIPEYWIVNLRQDRIEVYRAPDAERRVYTDHRVAERGERIGLVAFPDIRIAVDDVLPWPPVRRHDD
jgi:Uma2 family endonuclease